MGKINVLVNLPEGFFTTPVLKDTFKRLEKMAAVRKRSHNTAEEIDKDLAWADAVIMWSWPKYTPELLDKAPKLRFSGHLDLTQSAAKLALDRGLPTSITKRAWSPSVAEMALGLTLCTLRKISNYHAAMRAGKEAWVRKMPDEFPAEERQLTGRSVGIIGFGAVGRRVGELLQPFRCDLRVYDPYLPDGIAEQLNAKKSNLLDLIRRSDVVIVSAASNPGTRHLLGKKEIASFRKGAVLVNVARAALLDTAALLARLKKNDMYAALDVFDKEPLDPKSPFRKLPNVFLTPHRAGGILESVQRIVTQLVDDLEAELNGKPRAHALTEKLLPTLDG
jgi:phosphoglycerate dehydrogenase-like enzyme